MPRPMRHVQTTAARQALTPSPPAPSDAELSEVIEPEMEDVEGEAGESPEEGDEEEAEHEGEADENPDGEKTAAFDPSSLKEIGNLASWTVSTSKPGCGVEALRDEDPNLFWQSDGPQPHLLNIHFTRLVPIVHIRLYLDFTLDESYTPTKLSFLAGTSHHDLQEFVELAFEQPKGWIDVDLSGVGGGGGRARPGADPDEPVLRAHLVQVRISENHQNGKDTHVRGLQIFAREESRRAVSAAVAPGPGKDWGLAGWREKEMEAEDRDVSAEVLQSYDDPDWMDEPVLR